MKNSFEGERMESSQSIDYKQLSFFSTNEQSMNERRIKKHINSHNDNDNDIYYPFPSTRYQGSKHKISDWIWDNIKDLSFESALDAFGGTGSISHMLKRKGKRTTYNDLLKFNCVIGKALIENNSITLDDLDIKNIITPGCSIIYPTFIQDTFHDIFYLDKENAWLDMAVSNIKHLNCEYKKAIAWFALFQSCLSKRPYNLFHRANLYVRTSDVKRKFGNKTTWDKSFEEHFLFFVKEANRAIFDNGKQCNAINYDALEIPSLGFDLVYIDTPYISSKGVGTDYMDFYHFLEGMLDYDNWANRIIRDYKHLPLIGKGENVWSDKKKIYNAFESLFEKYRDSILVISYRSDGIPSETDLLALLKKYKNNINEVKSKNYQYALSNNKSAEILIIAT